MKKCNVLLEEYARILAEKKIDSPKLSVEILLAKAMGFSSLHLLRLHKEDILNASQYEIFLSTIERRILGEPIAYIVEEKEFFSTPFIVSSATLIPRPETEELVEHILHSFMKKQKEPRYILDIGTGSGCIACMLAKHTTNTRFFALDISIDALSIARRNAQRLHLEKTIEFLCADLYDLPFHNESFSYIVSNPPYISEKEYISLSKEVADFEPYKALVSGATGLEAFYAIIKQSYHLLKVMGWLYLEIGYTQKESLLNYMSNFEWKHLECIQDISGHNRFIVAQK